MGVAADHQRVAVAGVHELDQAVRRVAQADDLAHLEQALQARTQQAGRHEAHLAGLQRLDRMVSGHAQQRQHGGRGHAPAFGRRAMHQHRQALARQQQRQQRGQHRQLARAVVAGQHHGGASLGRHLVGAPGRGIEETGHFLRRLALDAHREAEGAEFELADAAVEQLAEQVGGLRAVERAGAVLAAPDFLEIVTDCHGAIFRDA